MISIPALFPCTMCGISLEKGAGPGNLAWHGCDPGSRTHVAVESAEIKGDGYLEALISKENLTIADAGIGLMRAALMQARDGELPPRVYGEIFQGLAKMGVSDGGSDADTLMRKFLGIGEEDEE